MIRNNLAIKTISNIRNFIKILYKKIFVKIIWLGSKFSLLSVRLASLACGTKTNIPGNVLVIENIDKSLAPCGFVDWYTPAKNGTSILAP